MKRHHALLIGLSMTSALMFGAPTRAAQPAPASSIAAAPDARAALATLDALAAGRWAAATHGFDAAMRQGLSPEKLRQLWQQLQQQNGAYLGHGAAVAAPAPTPYHSVLVPLRFSRATLGLLLSYDARGALAGLHIVPVAPSAAAPQPTGAVAARLARQAACLHAQPVAVDSTGAVLHGTLTLPRSGAGPFAAVLLLPGSGPVDENGNAPGALGNSMYQQLAYDLTCQGYAVLRYNKLGLAPSTGNGNDVTLATYVRNTRDLVTWLARRSAINPHEIILMGHSEGGLIALAAAPGLKIAGVISLEGPGEPMARIIESQAIAEAKLRGASRAQIARERAQIDATLAAIRHSHGVSLSLGGALARNPFARLFAPAAGLLRSEIDVDPAQLARAIHVPMLITQGGKDVQVLPGNGQRLARAAPQATLARFPDMTHDLIHCAGKAIACVMPQPGDVLDAHLVTRVVRWLDALRATPRHAA
ncbi:alpha/beta fold hydrolase [Metallibacterium sp.]|uniref:alpha/beta hydrolase n=1 Tax=Metallibacterium sp. TaxID=2940281 RepID=UPI0026094C4B|nr:alpha/beta fold hydrolase [Metallibacterium sp.]